MSLFRFFFRCPAPARLIAFQKKKQKKRKRIIQGRHSQKARERSGLRRVKASGWLNSAVDLLFA